jgi:hypothetical protein
MEITSNITKFLSSGFQFLRLQVKEHKCQISSTEYVFFQV